LETFMRQLIVFLFVLQCLPFSVVAQNAWRIETSGTTEQLRGLSVINTKVAWASGVKGTVLRTIDGEKWIAMQVAGASDLDFRDIHAVNDSTAYVMSAGPGAASRIYKTTDGGQNWTLQITNPDAQGFWDAFAFWDANNGIVFGDAVKGVFQARVTTDGGATWNPVSDPAGLAALPDEGGFAASGTCLTVFGERDVWFATGGAKTSRVLRSSDRGKHWVASVTPVPAAAATKGLFSVAFLNARQGFTVGGDYEKAKLDSLNGARTEDGGLTWVAAPVLPPGFMSVVTVVPGVANTFVAGGLAGSGYSTDGGKTWTTIDLTPVNTVAFADKQTGWAVGPKGLVMKYVGKSLASESTNK
jgi:photosystem II stability/assembly factor-like uncharacterized protein